MHPIMTLKSWTHWDHMMAEHGQMPGVRQLLHEGSFWAIMALIGILIALVLLATNLPLDYAPNFVQQYPPPHFID